MRKLLLSLASAVVMSFATFQANAQFTIDIPGATATYVTGINNSDHIVGYCTFEDGSVEGFYKLDEEIILLNIDNHNTWLGGINNNDMLVGRYNPSGTTDDYHVFIYDPAQGTTSQIVELDGYEWTSANDINDNMQISGDLKNGANRRFFIWSEEDGLNTQNYLIGGSPAPTYGGHSIDNSGRITGYYIDGANYYSFRYHPDFGYTDEVDLPDPEVNTVHKTRLMGANGSGKAVVDFILSDNCHIYDFNNPDAWVGLEKLIPGSTEIHMLDINDDDHVVGYYTDADFVVHGFADINIQTDFDLSVHGHAFNNEDDPMWNWDFEAYSLLYNTDPYWGYYGYNLEFPQITPGYLYPSTSYPGWSDYVVAMSTQSCYYNINFQGVPFDWPVMRPSAFSSWKMHRTDGFEGACFGMASNAGASWQYPDLLDTKFNFYPQTPFQEIYNLGVYQPLINASNQGMAAQASSQYASLNASSYDDLPHAIMNELYNLFTNGSNVPVVAFTLSINAGIFGHAVFPYAMQRGEDLNTYYLYYYDPNASGSYTSAFEIVYDTELSTYSTEWGSEWTPTLTYGMRLMDTEGIYEPQLLPGFTGEEELLLTHPEGDEDTNKDAECVRVFTLGSESYVIEGEGGMITVDDGVVESTIPSAQPYLNYGGRPQQINQYVLQTGDYTLSTAENEEGYFSGGMVVDGTIITYSRGGTTAGQDDVLEISGAQLSYVNETGAAADIQAEVSTHVGSSEFYYLINGLNLDTDQNISLEQLEEGLYISNDGTSTNYDVTVKVFTDNGYYTTTVDDIPIGDGITQIIIPNFVDDELEGITIVETDGDPETEDPTTDYENTGTPILILSNDTTYVTNAAQNLQIGVGNVGAGDIEWEVLSTPEWITVNTGNSGTNFSIIETSVAENPSGTRTGDFIVQATNADAILASMHIIQSDTETSINYITAEELLMYPNPTSRILNVKLPSAWENRTSRYEVRTLAGQLVLDGQVTGNQLTLDFAGFAQGYYTLSVNSGDLSLTEKIVKIP